MTFGVIACSECKRKRVVDLSSTSSKCPYCGKPAVHKKMQVLYKDQDAANVRKVFRNLTGYEGSTEKKRVDPDLDPLSSLVYEYERESGIDDKLEILSSGLTRIYGEFTLEDVKKVEPKHAEQYLKKMLSDCLVHETCYGRYKV